jgi:nucleoside triphosphate pyrophosphatase
MDIVLASSSPRRREILSYLRRPFTVHAADIDEMPQAGEVPVMLVQRLSRQKAAVVAAAMPPGEALVLAADTIVVIDGEIINKPRDAEHAEAILRQLRGRMHQVFTGLTLVRVPGNLETMWSAVCETQVHMRSYGDDEMLASIAAGGVFDKAGAYAIQDPVFHPVARIEGCYMNVMGLPLCEVIRGLRAGGETLGAQEPIRHDCLRANGDPCWIEKH